MKGKFGIFLVGGFLVLSTVAAATGNFAVRLDIASRQGQNNQTVQQAQTGQATTAINVQRIALAEGAATGFGQFRTRSNVIAPGTPFNIYFEPTNLAARTQNGNVSHSMSVDVLVRNTQGQTVVARDNLWQLPLSRTVAQAQAQPQLYADLTVTRLDLPEGRYQLVLRIHDDFNGTFADRVLDIELRRAAAGPRLSQSGQVGAQQTR